MTGSRQKNRLPILIAISLFLDALMVLLPQLPALSIFFVGVTWLSLRSSRTWHAYASAFLTTALLLWHFNTIQLSLASANIAIVIAAIWAVTLLGVVTMARNHDEVRTRAAAQAAGLWVWELDMAGATIWDTNRPTGLGLERVEDRQVYKQLTRLMSSSERHATKAALEAAFAERAPTVARQYSITALDGSIRHYQGQALVSYDILGRPYRVIGITRENTQEVLKTEQIERQAAQLCDVQLRMQRAADSSQEGHWVLDLQTSQYWVSDTYRKLLGFPHELEAGELDILRTLIHPDQRDDQLKLIKQSFETGVTYECELRIKHTNGEWRWFRTRGNVERNADGVPIHLSGSISDIHHQKMVEDNLLITRERFERAIRGTQDGLWEGEFLEPQDIWCSPRCLELLGYDSKDEAALIAGMAISERIHPDDMPLIKQAYEHAIAHGGVFDVEHRLHTRQGSWIWVRSRATLQFDAIGRPIRISGSMQDVTTAHDAHQELLKAIEAAQAANHAKNAFLANISHEIRTPMNGIIGMTELLLTTSLDATQFEYADIVSKSADSLLTVINDILDFSKIETGEIYLQCVEIDVRANVEGIGKLMSAQAAAKQLDLHVNIQPEVKDRYLGDPHRIGQCLINLISNAIKFTLKGNISIEVSVHGQQDGKALIRFEVRDTGVGIDPTMLATLFQPFVQADSSATRNFGGTGLGLSIVKRLADMMGAQVGVSSQLGEGSTFWMMLPLAEVSTVDVCPSVDAQSTDTVKPLANINRQVLLVEDNDVNQKVATRFLECLGCTVTVARDGAAAVQIFQQKRFDLVLMDIQMPVMDGMTATRLIRKLEGSRPRTPIVALTADVLAGQRERCLAEGMDEYLTKPVDFEKLRQVIVKSCYQNRSDLALTMHPALRNMHADKVLDMHSPQSALSEQPTRYVHLEKFIAIVGGDGEFAHELTTLFIESAQQTYADIVAASQRGDRQQVARAAHKLRGSSANIFAESIFSICELLEKQAASQSEIDLQACVRNLEAQLRYTAEELEHAVILVRSAA